MIAPSFYLKSLPLYSLASYKNIRHSSCASDLSEVFHSGKLFTIQYTGFCLIYKKKKILWVLGW